MTDKEFDFYLQQPADGKYYNLNSLAYYFEDMAKKEILIKELAKRIVEYDAKQNLQLTDIEQQVSAELSKWDQKTTELPETVNELMQAWVDDGTLSHVIDTTLIDEKVAPLTAQLADTTKVVGKSFAKNNLIAPSTTKKAYMTISDDDTRLEVWDKLKPISEELGVPITLAAPVRNAETTSATELTKEQLLYLQNNLGWEITSHSYTHKNLRVLSDEQLEYELNESKKVLESWGLNINNFIAPYGSNDAPNVRKIASKYYNCGATVGGGVNKKPVKNHMLSRVALGSFTGANNTLAFYKAQVDEAIANDGWIIFMTHCHDAAHDATQNQHLRDVIIYAQSKGVEIVNLQDGFDKMGNILDVEGLTQISFQGEIFKGGLQLDNPGIRTVYDGTQNSVSPLSDYQQNTVSINDINNAKKGTFPDMGIVHTFRPRGGVMDDEWGYQILYGYNDSIHYRRWRTNIWKPWQLLSTTPPPQVVSVTTTTGPYVVTTGKSKIITLETGVALAGKRLTVTPGSFLFGELIYSIQRDGTKVQVSLFNTHTADLTIPNTTWIVHIG